jgi:CRP/FNR family transcriptional regulator, anaerobic regulatory protein
MSVSSNFAQQLLFMLHQKTHPLQIELGTELLKQGQYIQAIPIVTKGLIKVFTRTEEKELLLYYIQPGESCIMSFDAAMRQGSSEVFAVTEEDTELLPIPVAELENWMRDIPLLQRFFYQLYHQRYHDLIHTIQQLMYERLDTRLVHYLKQRQELAGQPELHMTHQQIANELATSREVVSRLLKKLEREGKLKLSPGTVVLTGL